ncbi:hypothetical protein AVEN_198341-1, partial [Araneus ventricosus]
YEDTDDDKEAEEKPSSDEETLHALLTSSTVQYLDETVNEHYERVIE